MRKLIITCSVLLISIGSHSQEAFLFGGYRMGKYFASEPLSQNYAAKFNAGWEFQPDGAPIPLFFPDDEEFAITKYMEWGNLPAGINIGMFGEVEDGWCIGFGFQQLGEKASGDRTNVTRGSVEKFTIQSQATTLSFGIGYNVADLIAPYINFEFGRYRYRYSYESDQYDINNQRLGYNVRLFGATKPGSKPLCMALDYGFYVKVLSIGDLSLRIAPQYSARLDLMEEIFMGLYMDKMFKHDNFSVAALLTYNFE